MNYLSLKRIYNNAMKQNLKPYYINDKIDKYVMNIENLFKENGFITFLRDDDKIILKNMLIGENLNLHIIEGDKINLSKLKYIGDSFNRSRKRKIEKTRKIVKKVDLFGEIVFKNLNEYFLKNGFTTDEVTYKDLYGENKFYKKGKRNIILIQREQRLFYDVPNLKYLIVVDKISNLYKNIFLHNPKIKFNFLKNLDKS